MSTIENYPATQQTDYFRVTETHWRGVINSEDLTVGSLLDVLGSAVDAGMPKDALVEIKPGDCVINVRVKDSRIVTLPRRDDVKGDCLASDQYYFCTRDAGHSGPHEASNGIAVVHSWSDAQVEAVQS